MGREVVRVHVRIEEAGKSSDAVCKALLESNEIVIRGALRGRFDIAAAKKFVAQGGILSFESAGRRVSIDLGVDAPVWLKKIKNPRSRVQKLGVKPGDRVCVLGPAESDAINELRDATGDEPASRLRAGLDLVLFFTKKPADLSRLDGIRDRLAPKGAMWVLWPKGLKDYKHEDVVSAGKASGLSQTRSIGFSERFTGLRFVRLKC